MFGFDSCVQALLKGAPRFCQACGQLRLQRCEGGVVMQLRVRALPCGACRSFYWVGIEGGCGCRDIELAVVPAWQGEIAATCYLGGFSPENLVRRCACLAMNDGCGARVAEGVFRPCCGMTEERPGRCPACCAPGMPLYPSLPDCLSG